MPSVIADKVAADMGSASFIREMFEKGRRLKAEFGEDNVFDFSLGNPNATPPDAFFRALREAAEEHQPALHRYMPNVGFDEARAAVARFLRTEYGAPFEAADVIMTSGAAGGTGGVPTGAVGGALGRLATVAAKNPYTALATAAYVATVALFKLPGAADRFATSLV